jgi:hypothetical protein
LWNHDARDVTTRVTQLSLENQFQFMKVLQKKQAQ